VDEAWAKDGKTATNGESEVIARRGDDMQIAAVTRDNRGNLRDFPAKCVQKQLNDYDILIRARVAVILIRIKFHVTWQLFAKSEALCPEIRRRGLAGFLCQIFL